jgi:cytochrome b
MKSAAPDQVSPSLRVWDLPTRLFHWLLVVLIAAQYATGEFHWLDMRWHFWFGYATLALILFRVIWGFCGSQTSRFADFVRGPGAVLRYMKSKFSTYPQMSIGHNPLGGWSVVILLLCVLVQALSGLFSSDDIDSDGPFAAWVSQAAIKWMTRLHHWNQNVLLILIALHVVAILLYLLLRHDNLIVPMISGKRKLAPPQSVRFASSWRALAAFALAAAVVAAAVWLGAS